MLGYELKEQYGNNSLVFVHQDDLPRLTEHLAKLLQNPGGVIRDVARVWHKDGSLRTLEVIGHNLVDNPSVAGIVANLRDVTDIKRAEEEKEQMEQQLQMAGRLAAVGELAAGVAHELNNPLSAVQAYGQFLSSRNDIAEDIRKDAEIIFREAQRAAKVTSNLLAFARRNIPEKSLISINDVVERSLELHSYRMQTNNIEVMREYDPELPETMADFHQLQQVFVNIINNAEQAMTDANGCGRLTVKTRKMARMIRVAFTDNGPGIIQQDLEKIFDPFFTTKTVGKGTGLGLSISFGIIQDHGGRLYARSKPSEGATFLVEIPLVSNATSKK
jgi:PAS domain S-box-containing protein